MVKPIQRKKILIVDDSEIVLTVAQHALQAAGYEVLTYPRPAGCIAFILQETPDLLLIDVNMPGLNGDTLVKMLSATQTTGEMVVLLHSSLSENVLSEKAAASRAHGYIRKTESSQDLVRQVARWIRPNNNSGTHTIERTSVGMLRHPSNSRLKSEHLKSSPVAEPTVAVSGRVMVSAAPAGKILLADHEMTELSDLRRLVASQPGPVEFALSGSEVLRRIQGNSVPDIVILGRLIGSPSTEEVLEEAVQLHPRWKSRFILVHDGAADSRSVSPIKTRLRRPLTEIVLRNAIDNCMQFAG